MAAPNPVIAIDGTAASGKGTIASGLSAHYGFEKIDSGLLYRYAAYHGLDHPDAVLSPAVLQRFWQDFRVKGDHVELKSEAVAKKTALVAQNPAVRNTVNAAQRLIASDLLGRVPGVIVDGRDIGTIVFPDAAVKIFVTASAEVRARRRAQELHKRGIEVRESDILADIIARDREDMMRKTAPLTQAPDAMLLDTSDLSIEASVQRAVALVEAQREGR